MAVPMELYFYTLTMSSIITSTQLQRAIFFLSETKHFWLTSMFKKCSYNEL